MRPRDWRIRLEDILEAINRVTTYTEGMSYQQFCRDTKTVDAVVRNLEIIGEAARYVGPDLEEKHPEVPWDRMRGMRNILAHEYFGVDLSILWQTVQHDLPPLVPLLRAVLEAGNPGER
ncbi:MAG: DUF86 domain-containing protein [Chloroflexi bacterium]|nr:DUF86 domain-containing protein [Chloroflexota bacterium]MBI4338462.1 DUF86 domain-containing protein [Chloroflexota bacterium]